MLNQIIGSVGPAALAGIPGLSALVGNLGKDGTVSSDLANQVSTAQVQQAASHLQSGNPSIVDSVSRFYAAHPNVVKSLGAAAITIAMRHIAQRT